MARDLACRVALQCEQCACACESACACAMCHVHVHVHVCVCMCMCSYSPSSSHAALSTPHTLELYPPPAFPLMLAHPARRLERIRSSRTRISGTLPPCLGACYPHLPASARISPHICPHICPHLPIPPRISPHLISGTLLPSLGVPRPPARPPPTTLRAASHSQPEL